MVFLLPVEFTGAPSLDTYDCQVDRELKVHSWLTDSGQGVAD